MSWFQSTNFAHLAKNALKEAQKTIDKALDISEEDNDSSNSNSSISNVTEAASDFFTSWGVAANQRKKKYESESEDIVSENSNHLPHSASMSTSLYVPNNTNESSSKFHKRSQSAGTGDPFTYTNNTTFDSSMTKSDDEMVPVDLMAPSSPTKDPDHLSSWEPWDDTEHRELNFSSSFQTNEIVHSSEKQNVPLLISFSSNSVNPMLFANSSSSDFDPSPSQSSFEQLSSIDLSGTNSSTFQIEPPLIANNSSSSNLDVPNISESIGASSGEDTITEPDNSVQKSTVKEMETDEHSYPTSPKLTSRATSSISVLSEEKDLSSPSSPVIQNEMVQNAKPTKEEKSSIDYGTLHVNTDDKNECQEDADVNAVLEDDRKSEEINDSSHVSPNSNYTANSEQSSSSIVVVSAPPSTTYDDSEPSNIVDSTDERHHEKGDPPSSVGSGSDKSKEHKKGASSASSSDIEIIPFDMNYHHNQHLETSHPLFMGSSEQTIKEFAEVEIQTDEVVVDDSSKLSKSDCKKISKLERVLEEKDVEIRQLREEGEKLSKKQFDLSNIIKKLRAKEKENESSMKNLKVELYTKQTEVDQLMKTFVKKEGYEHTQNEIIARLSDEKGKLEIKVKDLSSKLEDMAENCATMKNSLENASKEISELKQVISTAHRESAELDNLTKEKSALLNRCESLQKEVDNLRLTLSTSQSASLKKESSLREEINSLTSKIHNLEEELANVSSEMADASMPLSLEIEKLQKELKFRQLQHDKRVSSFESIISENESRLKDVLQSQATATKNSDRLQEKISSLEAKLQLCEEDKTRLKTEIDSLTEEASRNKTEHLAKLSNHRDELLQLKNTIERLKSEKKQLEEDLKGEKQATETEKKKNLQLTEQLVKLQQKSGGTGPCSSVNHVGHSPRSGENSPSNQSYTSEASYLDEVFDQGSRRSLTPKSFFDSFSTTNMVEALQSQLRLREGEVISLQDEVSKNERLRKTLNEEIAKLTLDNQQLSLEKERMEDLQVKLKEMEATYNALLQMYGEKVEEADELRMDLQDVKEMYKNQIEQLLKK